MDLPEPVNVSPPTVGAMCIATEFSKIERFKTSVVLTPPYLDRQCIVEASERFRNYINSGPGLGFYAAFSFFSFSSSFPDGVSVRRSSGRRITNHA